MDIGLKEEDQKKDEEVLLKESNRSEPTGEGEGAGIHIDIFKSWCKGCGICVAFCPVGVLGKDEMGYPYVKDLGKCINCGWCEVRCPDFAITVEERGKVKEKVKAEDKAKAEDKDKAKRGVEEKDEKGN